MGRLISEKYAAWQAECEERFQQLKKNEEELNRIFIDIYGLQDELTPDVAEKDITVHRVFDSKDDVPESMKGSNYVRTMFDAGGSRKEMCAYFKRSEGSLAARLVRLGKISDRAEFRMK